MLNRMLIPIIIVLLGFLTFLSWHFLLSIYEVKYKTNIPKGFILMGMQYNVDAVGLNSLGWEISFRELQIEVLINEGTSNIKFKNDLTKNRISFIPIKAGKVSFLVNSKYSLNPTKYDLIILDEEQQE